MTAPAFAVPDHLIAIEPAEVSGSGREDVRLMVVDDRLVHTRFDRLADHLHAGDVVVVNDSRTMPAALDAELHGNPITVHVAGPTGDQWVIELRGLDGPHHGGDVADVVRLPGKNALVLQERRGRLWAAAATRPIGLGYLRRHGRPIRYGYQPHSWPMEAYQTVFARRRQVFQSAEMPSAGRPFISAIVRELRRHGTALATITLHTGLSSFERDERPAPERFRVGVGAARAINRAKQQGGRVIAVGTTVTRALETVGRPDRSVRPGKGVTDLYLTPDRPAVVVDGIITGWHPPDATHLLLLEAVAGAERVATAYREAVAGGYRWHEFGDAALLMRPPNSSR